MPYDQAPYGLEMATVLITQRLLEGSLEPLETDGHELIQPGQSGPMSEDELLDAVRRVDGVVCTLTDRITAAVLEAGARERLKVVGTASVGFDHIDVAAAKRLGVAVCNTPGVLDESTADLAFFLILAAARRTSDSEADLRAGAWTGPTLAGHLGVDVHGATLGLVGFGRIARQVARRAEGFGMRVLHHSRRDTGEAGYVGVLEDLLALADIVSLHVPLDTSTRHLIGPAQLAAMRPSSILVNTARGPVVDEAALADALEAGRIFGAGLDVYENEPAVDPGLLAARHVTLLPHVGSATLATRKAIGRLACQGVDDLLAGRAPGAPVT